MSFKKNRYLLLSFILFAITSCKGQKMEEKFEWTGTVSAPEEYPVEVYKGAIIANDFTYSFDAIWGTQNTGWGNDGGVMSVSTTQMEAPDSLSFTWLSLMEKKFYTGKWKLDKARIAELFRAGFKDNLTNKKDNYTLIKIGLAPKGKVVVWLSGPGFQTEVGAFEANETTISKEQAYPNAKYMLEPNFITLTLEDKMIMKPEILDRIKINGMPDPAVYELYRKKYQWHTEVHLPVKDQLILCYYNFLNGEEENRFGEDLVTNPYVLRAVPKYITLVWKKEDGTKYGLEIKPFDEKETIASFEKLGNSSEIDLVVSLNADGKGAKISLKNSTEEIQLNRAKIDISKVD